MNPGVPDVLFDGSKANIDRHAVVLYENDNHGNGVEPTLNLAKTLSGIISIDLCRGRPAVGGAVGVTAPTTAVRPHVGSS
jgi:hypothetical protein